MPIKKKKFHDIPHGDLGHAFYDIECFREIINDN